MLEVTNDRPNLESHLLVPVGLGVGSTRNLQPPGVWWHADRSKRRCSDVDGWPGIRCLDGG
jgi:hypothetical protein